MTNKPLCTDHLWTEVDRHENADRIRVKHRCLTCDATRYGCFSKRPDDDSWGPFNQWRFSNP